MNTMINEVGKTAKEVFRKYVYSAGAVLLVNSAKAPIH
jgi:hypothetical protein